MNSLDYVLFAIIAVAALRCWFKGIIGEVLSTAALIGGLLAGIFFYRQIGAWISTVIALGGLEPFVGFVASFAIVFIVVKIIESSLRSILENLNLDFLDKILGLGFGVLEGIIISAIILLVLRYQPLFDVGGLLEGSLVARILLPVIAERFPAAAGEALAITALRKV